MLPVLEDKFHDAIDELYERNMHLATQVSRLGYPELITGYPPTACVAWDESRKKIRFMFNSNFCDHLTFNEFMFVVAHEAVHIINGHIFTLKTEIDKMKNKKRTVEEISKYKRRFNIASDCVVNDSLVFLYNVPREEFADIGIFYGQPTVGCDAYDLTVTDVLKILPEKLGQVGNHDMWDSFFEQNGTIKKGFVDLVKDLIDNCDTNPDLSDKEADAVDELKRSMAKCSDANAKQAGMDSMSGTKKIKTLNAALSWDKILCKKTERAKFEETWNRPDRKLISSYPKVILPTSRPKEVKDIFIAIDVSGSIDHDALELFISVVKNTPKNFNISAITFDTSCQPFDINSDEVHAGGGTSFAIIEKYIREKLKRYPSAVFVLTDGCGDTVVPQYPERWTWMLYGASSDRYCKEMTHYELQKVLK